MTKICTSDDYAVAIVAAARLQGEDPEAIAQGKPNSRARWYALAALLEHCGGNDPRALAMGVGIFKKETLERADGYIRDYRRGHRGRQNWWDERRVAVIVKALKDGRVPLDLPRFLPAVETPAEAIPAPKIIAPLRDEGSFTFTRPAARRRINITSAILGDPGPGRSALAQRQAEKAIS